jgi:hypothetical protein
MSAEQLRAEIDRIKSDPEYIKLSRQHRGELEQKNFDKYRLRIIGLEAKIKASKPAVDAKKPVSRQTGPIRHPVNPAVARLAREPAPGAKDKEKIVINKSKTVANRDAHAALVKTNEVDLFINGPSSVQDDPVNNDIFDELVFDDEPMPDL